MKSRQPAFAWCQIQWIASEDKKVVLVRMFALCYIRPFLLREAGKGFLIE